MCVLVWELMCMCPYVCVFCFTVLDIEFKALCMLSKYSITNGMPVPRVYYHIWLSKCTLFLNFDIYFYFMCMDISPTCIAVHHGCAWCLWRWGEGIKWPWSWSFRWLWATIWVVGIKLRSFGRAASTLPHWASSPAHLCSSHALVYVIKAWLKLSSSIKCLELWAM